MERIEIGLMAVGMLGAIIYVIGYTISSISKEHEESFKQMAFIGCLLAFGGPVASIAVSTSEIIFNFFR